MKVRYSILPKPTKELFTILNLCADVSMDAIRFSVDEDYRGIRVVRNDHFEYVISQFPVILVIEPMEGSKL